MRAAWFGLAIATLLAACATAPAQAPAPALFNDALFAPQAERIEAAAVFAPSPQMLAWVDSEVTSGLKAGNRAKALFDALYRQDGAPWLDYDATLTRNAAEAFAARSGNCLSLVLMTAALARQLDLEVKYQSVYTREAWSRSQGLDYLNAHVNVTLLVPHRPEAGELLIDFMSVPAGEHARSRVLGEHTIVAMYMNNRAVELLAQRELDRAYWWARAAMRQDPGYFGAANTLAVVYRARGRLDESERVLRWLLGVEPDNVVALDNLVGVLRTQGRDADAEAMAARLKELRPIPPFHFYDLGIAALNAGDYARARELFLKEMRRDANYDKFHASLALAYYGLGELPQAQAQMAIAQRNSTTLADREMYGRMLARLRAGQHP